MERSEENDFFRKPIFNPMSEFWQLLERRPAEFCETSHGRIKAHFAEADDHPQAIQLFQFSQEKWTTVVYLGRKQLVLGRGTSTRRCNIAVAEFQSVIPGYRSGLVCESEFIERLIEPVAATVAREHPTCAVTSVGRRRKPNEQELCR